MRDLGLIKRCRASRGAGRERANPLYPAYTRGFDDFEPIVAQPTLATAIQIGNPVSFTRAVRTLSACNGVVEQASESELAEAAARADLTGMFNGPHTGVALAALEKLVRARRRFSRSAHGGDLHRQRPEVHRLQGRATTRMRWANSAFARSLANRPIELEPDLDAVKRAVL